jgi:3-hydroxyisobutyrate dehydrogenase-like beta-hydroxyacid dehydrogenase
MNHVTLIGFGEAGQAFAVDEGWRAFDIVPEKSRSASLAEAMEGANAVLSLVTADEALNAAKQAAELIAPGTFFFDMNSIAPDTKRAAAAIIDARGGRYVDVAVMSPVHPARLATPLLVSAPYAEDGAALLLQLGFTGVRVVGSEVGRASTIKMLRSVIYKGMEALTAECLIACEKADVTDEVLGSFGNDWASGADYRLDRMMVHGGRRSAEMEEVVKTLEALGVDPLMTRGTVVRQRAIGGLGVSPVPEGLEKKLASIVVTPAKAGVHEHDVENPEPAAIMDSRLCGNDWSKR